MLRRLRQLVGLVDKQDAAARLEGISTENTQGASASMGQGGREGEQGREGGREGEGREIRTDREGDNTPHLFDLLCGLQCRLVDMASDQVALLRNHKSEAR